MTRRGPRLRLMEHLPLVKLRSFLSLIHSTLTHIPALSFAFAYRSFDGILATLATAQLVAKRAMVSRMGKLN